MHWSWHRAVHWQSVVWAAYFLHPLMTDVVNSTIQLYHSIQRIEHIHIERRCDLVNIRCCLSIVMQTTLVLMLLFCNHRCLQTVEIDGLYRRSGVETLATFAGTSNAAMQIDVFIEWWYVWKSVGSEHTRINCLIVTWQQLSNYLVLSSQGQLYYF